MRPMASSHRSTRTARRLGTGMLPGLGLCLLVLALCALAAPRTTAGSGSLATVSTVRPRAATAALDLPRIPWEGGASYWRQFRNADAGGWSKPSFFPIAIWFNGISSDSEASWDKAHGVNTYIGMWEGTDFSLFERNHVYWIGEGLNKTFKPSSPYWVGNFLDDEVDGRYSPSAGFRHLQGLVDANAGSGRFDYANFTQAVIGDLPDSVAQQYVNRYTDAVSLDMYWYTIPYCDWRPYDSTKYIVPVRQDHCRTASSYGKAVSALRQRDAADGHRQPIWQFVEDLNGGPGSPHVGYITPPQLKGAVMSSVINEARGLVYFNQSLSGPCQGGSILRQAQIRAHFCGAGQVAAMGSVNHQIHTLAPVINTQSYRYRFGNGLQTMLKTRGRYAYVFAMVNGSSDPGSRTFQLPPGVHGNSVRVLFENRTIPVRNHRFRDDFPRETTYHVYRVAL